MNKSEKFDESLQELARFAKVISHPARLAILEFLAQSETCMSGDISDFLPLGRTTVSQHLKELRNTGLIQGDIDGLKVNYCLRPEKIDHLLTLFDAFFVKVKNAKTFCKTK